MTTVDGRRRLTHGERQAVRQATRECFRLFDDGQGLTPRQVELVRDHLEMIGSIVNYPPPWVLTHLQVTHPIGTWEQSYDALLALTAPDGYVPKEEPCETG